MKKNWKKLLISLAIPQLAGALGSLFTAQTVSTWYRTLEKPALNPPSWVFGPVWTTIFILIGVSLFLVWKSGNENKKMALGIFAVQMVLNVLWSALFFGLRSPGAALLGIVILWVVIILNLISFYRINKWAGILFWPYLLWVTFATYLNFQIWLLNQG